MFSKIVVIFAIVAYAQAVELGHATSYSSVSQHVAPAAHAVVAAPIAHIAHVAPVAHVAHISHVAPIAHVAHISHVAPVAHVAHIAPIAHVAPVVKTIQKEIYADAHPHYSFEYGVKDTHTHDIKNQHEERDGDAVKGSYSLEQPDGVTRTVHYTSDDKNGFNAQVEYKGKAAHPEIVKKAVLIH